LKWLGIGVHFSGLSTDTSTADAGLRGGGGQRAPVAAATAKATGHPGIDGISDEPTIVARSNARASDRGRAARTISGCLLLPLPPPPLRPLPSLRVILLPPGFTMTLPFPGRHLAVGVLLASGIESHGQLN
jgi:hypothetical protein